jgi:hypothetical protein
MLKRSPVVAIGIDDERALNHGVSRDAQMLAVNENGLDKRQTPNPGEA